MKMQPKPDLKRMRPLWTTRFNLPEQGNDFPEQVAGLIQAAGRFFGQRTKRLVRDRLPDTPVEFGGAKAIGVKELKE